METFWTLFKESVIIQAILALLFAATVCTLFLRGLEVPGELLAMLGTVIGYYFGSKNRNAALKSQVSQGDAQEVLDRAESILRELTAAMTQTAAESEDPRIEGLIDQERDTRDYS